MKRASHPRGNPAPPPRLEPVWRRYYGDTPRPLYCLLFLFPLVAVYEFGALLLRPLVWPERQLVAHSLIQKLMGWFGASGFWLPALALLLTLLAWHLLVRQPWRIQLWVLPLMALESVLLTAPLFVLGQVLLRAGTALLAADARQQVVLDLGAGIYEELVFRLYLLGGLLLLLVHVLRVPRFAAAVAAVGLSALIFAGCHFLPVGSESFGWNRFLLRALAGAYLGIVYLGRGLGIAAGCHAAFNLIPLLLHWPG